MGQIVRRKRKGRPANSDRAHRSSPVAPQSPVDRQSSRRRLNVRYNFDIDDYVGDDEFFDDYNVEIGRRDKKIRLLLCQDDVDSRANRRSVSHAPSSSSEDDCKSSKKWKVVGYDDDVDNEIEEIRGRKVVEEDEEEEEEEVEGTDFVCGTVSDLPKGVVSMRDKKTLELIFDKLQKRDIYGVYAQPVDPDELPDYYDVIKHPMDFATVRKKLAKGSYLTLKELESDVFLICSNAMQYNAPDTIYYKQASSIQEQAKLRFQRLRANNVDRSEIELKTEQKTLPSFSLPKKQSFSLPKKQLKKSVARTPQDPGGSETFSGATVRTGEFPNSSSPQTLSRANSVEVPIAENSPIPDNNLDKDQELLAEKGFNSKFGRKPSVHDENRRATYNIDFEPVTDSDSIFSTFEGESKQLIPVGLHADHSYARSLARFAATLGSIAWKVASHTIEQALPKGVKYGRGWVGQYEPLSTPVLIPENHRSLKEPIFFTIKNDEKAAKFTTPAINKALKMDSGCELPAFFNTGIPAKQESFKEAGKTPIPKPFYSSLQANYGSNLQHQNTPPVELNHRPPMHVSAADFVAKRPVSHASDVPSPRPSTSVSRNGNLSSLGSVKHSNTNNDGFATRRPSKTAGLDCNRMAPMDNNMSHRHEGKPLAVNQDFNRMVPMDNNMTYLQEGKQLAFNRDCNRMVHMDNNINRQQEQQGLSYPVHMMKMLAEKAKTQMNNSNGFGFGSKREDSNNAASTIPQLHSNNPQICLKRDNSNNVSLTAAQAWMSLGAGEFVKQPLAENINPHKQQISPASLHNHQQPFKTVNEGQLQNRNVGFPQIVTTDLSRFQGQSSLRGVNPQIMQVQSRPKQQESRPPDLNIGYRSMGVDSQQPDLALQL